MADSAAVPETFAEQVLEGQDHSLVAALRAGDEGTFADLVSAWTPVMLRIALVHAPSRAVAEEVVQEAWLTVLRDLAHFKARSALRTWVLGIVVNLARSRARSEQRSTPVPLDEAGPVVDARRFRPPDAPHYPHHWALGPKRWPTPEEGLLAGETRTVIFSAITALPPAQREVLVLRDVAGWTAQEACDVLRLSDANQRVLLHRARSRVRRALEDYFGATEPT